MLRVLVLALCLVIWSCQKVGVSDTHVRNVWVSGQPRHPQWLSVCTAGEPERWWRKEWLIKGVYIWLGVVSLLALVAFIWSIVLCALWTSLKTKTERRDEPPHSFNAYQVK